MTSLDPYTTPSDFPLDSDLDNTRECVDLCYAFSDDNGRTWRNTKDVEMANLAQNIPLSSSSSAFNPKDGSGVKTFAIPSDQGLLSIESQCAGAAGGFHALCRHSDTDSLADSRFFSWVHYYRSPNGAWSRRIIHIPSHAAELTPTASGPKGEICAVAKGDVYLLLPSNNGSSGLSLMGTQFMASSGEFGPFELLWQGYGFAGEPLVDEMRLRDWGVLSAFTRTVRPPDGGFGELGVLEFEVGGSCGDGQ